MGEDLKDRFRILVVDDDPDVLMALKRSLYSSVFEIVLKRDARDALSIMEENEFDVLLSDLDMPYLDGLELLARVRNMSPQTIRVLITGVGSRDSAIRAINEGEVHRYITKPWDSDALREMMLELVERKKEFGRLARAGKQARRRKEFVAHLEEEFPGITSVILDGDGVYTVNEISKSEEKALLPLRALLN